MDLSGALGLWRTLLGDGQVLAADAAMQAYGSDTGASRRSLAGALRIRAAASLPEVMRIASQCRVSVYPVSTGNNWGYGSALPPRDGCVLLDLSGLQMILHFDSELGVVTLEPGVTQQMLADFLRQGDYPFLVPVTGAGPHCSLVGNALERGYGITPHADHFGAVTDLQAVLADGSIYRSALNEAGGGELARLFKWGVGPYCNGLFTQSGFGIVVRMSIVLARRPECTMACLFSLRDEQLLEQAVPAVRDLLGSLPGVLGGINLMNRWRVLAMAAPQAPLPLEPAKLGQLGRLHRVAPWTGFASLYGTRRSVAAARHALRQRLRGIASRTLFVTPQRAALLQRLARLLPARLGKGLQASTRTLSGGLQLVAGVPNETALALAYGHSSRTSGPDPRNPARDGCGLLWYSPLVPMRAERVRAYVDMVQRVTQRHGVAPLITLTSLGERVFDSTVPLLFDRSDPGAVAAAQSCQQALLEAGSAQGWYPYRLGIDSMDWFAALQGEGTALHRRLQQCLDPLGLVAPGRYG